MLHLGHYRLKTSKIAQKIREVYCQSQLVSSQTVFKLGFWISMRCICSLINKQWLEVGVANTFSLFVA